MSRLTDAEVRELADWFSSRHYDVGRDVLVTHLAPPAFSDRLDESTRVAIAMTVIELERSGRPSQP